MVSVPKQRLDQLLVDRGIAESRERAQRLVRAGLVLVNEQLSDKPGVRVDTAAEVRLKSSGCPYVSRGGLKLEGALAAFGIEHVEGWQCLDIGASTGGFTDYLLQRGAAHVWTVDTGRAQLHEKLRQDARVTSREQANARQIAPDWVGETALDLIVIDVSFISLRLILPGLPLLLKPEGQVVALVKPQFEAGPADVGRGGVVRDPAVHRRVLRELAAWCGASGWVVAGVCASPLKGPAGNCEFFFRLVRAGTVRTELPGAETLDNAIEQAMCAAYSGGERDV